MQTSRGKTGAGAWLLAVGAFLLFLAACAPHSTAASFDAAPAALRPGTLLWGYQGAFSAFTAAWSPDGHVLAIGEADGTVQVRDAVTGTLTLSLHGHTQQVWALAWSPDGKRLATASWDKTV